MARTFGVRAVASDDSIEGYNSSLGQGVSFPGGEYGGGNIEPNLGQYMNLDAIQGDAEVQETPSEVAAAPQIKQNTNPISATIADPMKPTDKGDEYYKRAIDKFNQADKDKEESRQMRGVLEIMETASGLMDAYFKHRVIVNQNNYNVIQANRQIVMVKNQAAFVALREQTKAQSRKDTAKMDAVARGQSSSGDVAGIAENNEEMYLAQNLMGIEISAMREILGLEQDIIQYQASSKISEYQRNASMANELATGAIRLGAL